MGKIMFCCCFTSSLIYTLIAHAHARTNASLIYLTIRQRGRVVYEQIVDEGETRVDYLLIDNEAELSNCFSINHHIKYKLGCENKI